MGFHGVQLLGLALIGFGIFWEIRHLDWPSSEYTSFIPQLGLIVVLAGVLLDPMVDARFLRRGA